MSNPSLEIGARVMCRWKDATLHPCEIINRRPLKKRIRISETGQDDSNEYYVHFLEFDRRLDEWVGPDRLTRQALPSHVAAITAHSEPHVSASEKEHEEITKVKNIHCIQIGRYEIDAWYFSPYPKEYCTEDKLYICEFCLKYMKKRKTLDRHMPPPGNEIYREDEVSVFEVDGQKHRVFCQNICLLAKLFLDHKTLYYDVDPFTFYLLCEYDDRGCHLVGYFSKEKCSPEDYNLACILTLPPFQRKGYGKLLISLSYELTKREGKVGSPEKPLSDLGKLSYRSYWSHVLLMLLKENKANLNVAEMSLMSGVKTDDIISTLQSLGLIKHWKGQHIISVSATSLDRLLERSQRMRLCNPECLHWEPIPPSGVGGATSTVPASSPATDILVDPCSFD